MLASMIPAAKLLTTWSHTTNTTYHMVTHHQHYLLHGHTPPTLLTTWSHTTNTTYYMVTHHQHYLPHGHTSPTLLTTWSHTTNTTYHMVTHHQHYLPHKPDVRLYLFGQSSSIFPNLYGSYILSA